MFNYLKMDLNWYENDLYSVLVIMSAIGGFLIYWGILMSEGIKARFLKSPDRDKALATHLVFTKFVGFFMMGVMPALVAFIFIPGTGMKGFGFRFVPETALTSLAWIAGLGIIVVPLMRFNAKKPESLKKYPQIRAKNWTRGMLAFNLLGWFVYLLGYEFLFRGVLLFSLVSTMGVFPAIAVNTALYSATHVPKGMDEAISAIPFGIVLCLLTLATGTIWIAVIVHVAMAWTTTLTAFKHHPDMKMIS